MTREPSTTTIGFRLDEAQLRSLETFRVASDRSLHDTARRLLLDRLSMLALDEIKADVADLNASIADLRRDFVVVSKRLMYMTNEVEASELSQWFSENVRSSG